MAIQIYILSMLMKEKSYPYKLKKRLSEPIPFDRVAGLTESKLYYHFDSLAKQGFIEPVEVIKEEHRPDKQVFAITEKGSKELPKKIYKLFEQADNISEMTIGLVNLQYVDRQRVLEILEKKLEDFKNRWATISSYESTLQVAPEKEKLIAFVGSYANGKAEYNLHWLESLIEAIRNEEF